MMFVKIVLLAVILLLVAGFGYFALTDITIPQQEKVINFSASDIQKQ